MTLLTPPDLLGAVRSRGLPPEVEIVPAPVDDIWMRDIAPVFAHGPDGIVAIDLKFNGWDNSRLRPSRPGDRLARIFDFGVPVGLWCLAPASSYTSNRGDTTLERET